MYKTYTINMNGINSKSSSQEITLHIANKILLLRKALKLTQEEFAERIGLSTRAVTRAESGKNRPTPETLEKISKSFEIPYGYFFDNSIYSMDIDKAQIIKEINSIFKVLSIEEIIKIKKILEIMK